MLTPVNRSWVCKKIVTNLAVLEVTKEGFKLLERAPGVSVQKIKESTVGNLIVDSEVPEISIS